LIVGNRSISENRNKLSERFEKIKLVKLHIDKKMAAFWVVAPCGLVLVYKRFRGT
jgi:hypothetical protein